ncbi:hypothetical protein SteCoe_895 [Stentor coeruleus]|uniref:Uncharacterized protein n=1 Tax=Stentor coeruleus TaxID=5963 RepID=A0A1R2D305_9CILI|nr:hypothetical protein SteCoe_895 [Stentor coeruleus]
MSIYRIKSRATTPLMPDRGTPKNYKNPPNTIFLPVGKQDFLSEHLKAIKYSRFLKPLPKHNFKIKSSSPEGRYIETGALSRLRSRPTKKGPKEISISYIREEKKSYESFKSKEQFDSDNENTIQEDVYKLYLSQN